MPNKNRQNEAFDETSLVMPKADQPISNENRSTDSSVGIFAESVESIDGHSGPDRRKLSRNHDRFYQCVAGLNIIAWIVLLAALVVFHYARPEFITGVQNFWGIEGRDFWSEDHLADLLTLLQICLVITIITLVLRSRRNRRKTDGLGVNILILLTISITSLVTIYMTV